MAALTSAFERTFIVVELTRGVEWLVAGGLHGMNDGGACCA